MKRTPYALAIALLMASCSVVPTPLPNGKGGAEKMNLWGGKGMVTYNADGSMSYSYDLEISFQHGAQTLAAIATYGLDTLVRLEEQLTAQLANANLTAIERDRIAAALAEVQANIAAKTGLKGAGIKAGAPLGPVNFE